MREHDVHPELDLSDFTEDQMARVLEFTGKAVLLERMDELARLAQAAREKQLSTGLDFSLYVGFRMMELAVEYLNERSGQRSDG